MIERKQKEGEYSRERRAIRKGEKKERYSENKQVQEKEKEK